VKKLKSRTAADKYVHILNRIPFGLYESTFHMLTVSLTVIYDITLILLI